MGVVDRDLGWGLFKGRVRSMRGGYTLVGIQANDAGRKESDGPTNAEIAYANEFGEEPTNPERSFLRSTFDESEQAMRERIHTEIAGVIEGRQDLRRGMGRVGEDFEGKIKAKIRSGVPPPNSPVTIARKESSVTLIDTGQMLNAVRHVEVLPHA